MGETVRFHVNLGRKQGIRPGDILGAIAGECGIPGSDVGEIEILDNYSFFNAAKEHRDAIIRGMEGAQIKGLDASVEISSQKKKDFKDRRYSKGDDSISPRKKQSLRKKY